MLSCIPKSAQSVLFHVIEFNIDSTLIVISKMPFYFELYLDIRKLTLNAFYVFILVYHTMSSWNLYPKCDSSVSHDKSKITNINVLLGLV